MPGRTYYLSDNPNSFAWSIPSGKGRAFEDLIERYLKKRVATRDSRVAITRTRATGDAGRDFEVRFSGEIELFGARLAAPVDSGQAMAFIECKSTEHERLDDEFLVDASQHRDSEACAYVLVTNAVITPYCHFRAQEEWRRRNIVFRLIDRRRLVEALHAAQMSAESSRFGLDLPDAADLKAFDRERLVVSWQTEQAVATERATARVYLTMSNYGSQSVLSDVSVSTDLAWLPETERYERVITPGAADSVVLALERQSSSPAELELSLRVDGRSQRIVIPRPEYRLSFDPPFIGEGHRNAARAIRAAAESSAGFLLVSIQGEGGIGKTRIVNEAVTPLASGQFEAFTFHFSPRRSSLMLNDFCRRLGLNEAGPDEVEAEDVSFVIREGAAAGVPILVHFEDVHHASEAAIRALKRLVIDPPHPANPLIVILSGRDDHTFPNEEYFSFLHLVAEREQPHVRQIGVEPLADAEARALIRSVVVDLPEVAVNRVHALGQNNPFVIVEVLQYLLDAHIGRLLSRRTVGVLNPEVFVGRGGLPATVDDLLDLRLEALAGATHGRLATEFLVVSSFFGFVVRDDVRRAFFDDEAEGDESWALLVERRFVREDPSNGELTFSHENILNHIRRRVRLPANSTRAASEILRRPGIAKRLDRLDLAEVYYLGGDAAAAFERFGEAWERVQAITNFSSEEIDPRLFHYLPALFHTALTNGAPKERLTKVVLAYGYMGVHNFPLVVAEDACTAAIHLLDELFHDEKEGLRERLAIRQLRAHALQNMGRTGEALREMLEIEGIVKPAPDRWPELRYDLFDRLQEYYRKANHLEVARSYAHLARDAVRAAGDSKLWASHLITRSLTNLYVGEKTARRLASDAHRAAKRVGIARFITYTRLTELVVETLYSRQDASVLAAVATEARALLRGAALAGFSDSIMRAELLLGTIALNGTDDPLGRARSYVVSGQADSLRFGNGLFDWAFDNLAAVVDLADENRSDEDVRARFRSCLERLKRRGLMFVGAESGLYPNTFAIANIVRFFGSFRESVGLEILRTAVTAYNNRFLEDDDIALGLVRRAVRGQTIFSPTRAQPHALRYPLPDGYFTPVF